jgi:hypothetical protein
VLSISRLFKTLLALVALGFTALLASCGGGGAADPFAPGPTPPTFNLLPRALNVYAGTPVVLTITSGVAPFRVFSSDSTVLPVTAVASGTTITLVANPISGEDREVTLTVTDALSRSITVAATVKSAPLLTSLNVIPVSESSCGVLAVGATRTDIAAICSGETATVRVTANTAGASPIANRQIRFDVVQGPFDFVIDQAGTVLAKTVTIVTDQNGQAITTIKANAAVGTQVALIRATDVVSGNRVDGSFSIVASIDGSPTLSVTPNEYTFTAYLDTQCGEGSVDMTIYGGTAPYRVFSTAPGIALLSIGNAVTLSQEVSVAASGGAFRATVAGAFCGSDREAPLTITDAAGRVITAKVISKRGSVAPTPPPTPDVLEINPPNMIIDCSVAPVTVRFTILGGTAPYSVATDRPSTLTPPAFNGTSIVSGSSVRLNQTYPSGTIIIFSVIDSKSLIKTANITCQ